jgi:hypothetical protein
MQAALRTRRLQQDNTWENTKHVITTIGNITMSWAGVERILDELIAFYQLHATNLQHEHPRSLSSKLKYLRLMQCDPRHNDQIREFLRVARIEGKKLGDRRHELIHGLVSRSRVRGKWTSQRVIYDGAYARLSVTPYEVADFEKVLRDINAYAHDLSIKVWVITRGRTPGFPASDMEQALRELGLA